MTQKENEKWDKLMRLYEEGSNLLDSYFTQVGEGQNARMKWQEDVEDALEDKFHAFFFSNPGGGATVERSSDELHRTRLKWLYRHLKGEYHHRYPYLRERT